MIVVLDANCTSENIEAVREHLLDTGLQAHTIEGVERTVIGVIGQIYPELQDELEVMNAVSEVIRVSKPYKLTSREFNPNDTVVTTGSFGAKVGGGEFAVFAGPCAVESEEQIVATARAVKAQGAKVLRGGAFKPRTSPYSFRGLGEEGLKMLAVAGRETGMPIITEVMSPNDVDLVYRYADVLQVGARNMQNIPSLTRRARSTSLSWSSAASQVPMRTCYSREST